MCFSIIKGKVVFNDTKQRKKKMHTYTQTHYKMQHHRCSFPDCASEATTKNRKGSESKKKKERQSSCTPHIHAKAHYVPLAKPNPTAVSPLLQDAAHHFAYTFMCNSVPCLTWKKKRDSRRWLRQDKSKKKGSPPLPNKKKGEKPTRTIIKVT